MTMGNGDDIAAGIGGSLMSILGAVTLRSIAEMALLAFVGGFIGILAKKMGEWCWNRLRCRKER